MISEFLKDGEILKKINSLKKSTDFERIIKNNRSYKYKDYFIYVERNTNDIYHFGLSVGKKIGNAVTRNKVKRQIRSMIDQIYFKNNFNCIIIVKKSYLNHTFNENSKCFKEAMEQLNLVKGIQNHEKKER